ncbi:cysteine-rich CWC family protein [Gemmatimonas sp.]|uniref:cysteine-rich CWC family protein n=1 Tax=Gemmatimonas sp. TaxID=1962908 RepID=UPI0031F453B4
MSSHSSPDADARLCPSCGAGNHCTMAAGAPDASDCWCSRSVAYLPGLLTTDRPAPSAAPEPMSCYCEPCLSAVRARGTTRSS